MNLTNFPLMNTIFNINSKNFGFFTYKYYLVEKKNDNTVEMDHC